MYSIKRLPLLGWVLFSILMFSFTHLQSQKAPIDITLKGKKKYLIKNNSSVPLGIIISHRGDTIYIPKREVKSFPRAKVTNQSTLKIYFSEKHWKVERQKLKESKTAIKKEYAMYKMWDKKVKATREKSDAKGLKESGDDGYKTSRTILGEAEQKSLKSVENAYNYLEGMYLASKGESNEVSNYFKPINLQSTIANLQAQR